MEIKRLPFDTINYIWKNYLWVDRKSAIESHSAMTWPFENNPNEFDMNIFNYPASFFGIKVDGKLIAVNSGHKTSETQYRSRGIWIDPKFRRQGLSQLLFNSVKEQAILEGCNMIWSLPRKTALSAYTKFGFKPMGDFLSTETSDSNIYVKLNLDNQA